MGNTLYHTECFNRLTNIKAIEQVVRRYEAAIQTTSSNVISRTPGRPSSNQSNKLTEEEEFVPYEKVFHVIWKNLLNKKWFSNTCQKENVWKFIFPTGNICTSVMIT